MLQFSCMVCLLSRYRPSNCIPKIMHVSSGNRGWLWKEPFVGRLFAGWLWKEPVLMQRCSKVASLGLHTRSESHLPLVDCIVDDVLRQTWPAVDEPLSQLTDVADRSLVHTLLHPAPDSVLCVRVRRLCVPNIMSSGVCFKKTESRQSWRVCLMQCQNSRFFSMQFERR